MLPRCYNKNNVNRVTTCLLSNTTSSNTTSLNSRMTPIPRSRAGAAAAHSGEKRKPQARERVSARHRHTRARHRQDANAKTQARMRTRKTPFREGGTAPLCVLRVRGPGSSLVVCLKIVVFLFRCFIHCLSLVVCFHVCLLRGPGSISLRFAVLRS